MLKSFAQLFYVIAAALLIFGVVVMYHYGDYDVRHNLTGSRFGHVIDEIQGDAFNYIIIATRGVGIIIVGAVFAIVASALLIFDKLEDVRYAITVADDRAYASSKQLAETLAPTPDKMHKTQITGVAPAESYPQELRT